ncbi:mucin-17-like [Dorcoceras hygrometricum]|uniref:Mucin-17-like n=1 Tax=Dorcoceras hygrometricum TaxID=472368 RepID=A0A2Z7DDF8_9LAMI|nr:mucin-17-like [Dorcoceras hygrometricum]
MAGLAMETSKAEPADRNQAKAMLNRDAYVDSFPYVESYVDSNPYVESIVNRYAYVEVQLYLLPRAENSKSYFRRPKRRNLAKNRGAHFIVVSLARWTVSEGIAQVSCENVMSDQLLKTRGAADQKLKADVDQKIRRK